MPKITKSTHSAWMCLIMGAMLAYSPGCASVPKAAAPPTPPTSANVGTTTIVAIAPSPSAGCDTTLPKLLGVPQFAQGVGGVLQRLGSRLLNGLDLTGRFPGLQPKPPLLPLTDAANLEDTAPPAVQAAAEIKQEEDAAPQKIMAIRYLATLGCGGCYEKVEEALLEGLSDCTEEVRFEAAKALQCKPECGCKFCSSPTCCSANVRKKLEELTHCEKEPSARIRRMARLSLECCRSVPLQADEDIPREGPPPAVEEASVAWPVKTPSQSGLFDNIQLVSFDLQLTPKSASDMILAYVNGEAIYESQVIPLVEEKLRSERIAGLHTLDENERRKQLTSELNRVIDWKLLEQLAKNEVWQANSNSSTIAISAEEIQAWFERKIQIDSFVPPQQLIAYYEIHRDQFLLPTKIRWERISVVNERCANHQQAMAVAAYLRDRALGGTMEPPFGFAREMVETETSGWSDLAKIEPSLFRLGLAALQIGQISNKIEFNNRLHLLRVLERSTVEHIPLPLVADQIQNQILTDRRKFAEINYLDRVRSQSQIWTAFDQPNRTGSTFETSIPSPGGAGGSETILNSVTQQTKKSSN